MQGNNLNQPLNQMAQPPAPVGQPMMGQPIHQNLNNYNPHNRAKQRKNLPGEFEGSDGGFLADMLEDIRGVFINQKTDWQQALTGCAKEQVFNVFDIDDKGTLLLQCKEKSDCCARACMAGSCRPFMMQVTNLVDNSVALWIERSFSCTCMCLNRPSAKIYVFGPNNEKMFLGEIKDVFRCCTYEFEITDHKGQKVYALDTPLCQKGLMCNCPCDDCNVVKFAIKDKQNKPVSQAVKEGKGCVKNALTNADIFQVFYTQNMPWNHRALLLCSILFLDFRMFEDKHKDKNNQNGGSYNY